MTDHPIRQLRLVLEASDFEAAATFFRDVLGMPSLASFSEGEDARVVILDAGRATLEITNPAHKRFIDEVEAEGATSPWIRLALEVDDAAAATAAAVEAGATLIAAPRLTPWRSINSRLEARAPQGLQLTLFQETVDQEERDRSPGFTR